MKKLLLLVCLLIIITGCDSDDSTVIEAEATPITAEESKPIPLSVDYFYDHSYQDVEAEYLGELIAIRGRVDGIDGKELYMSSNEDPSKWAFIDMVSEEEASLLAEGDDVILQGIFGEGMELVDILGNYKYTSNEDSAQEEPELEDVEVIEENEPKEEEKVVEEPPVEEDPFDGLSFTNFELEQMSTGSDDNPVATYIITFSVTNNSESIQYIEDDSFIINKGGDVLTVDYTDSFKVIPGQTIDYDFWFFKRTDKEDKSDSVSGYTINYVDLGKLHPIITFE